MTNTCKKIFECFDKDLDVIAPQPDGPLVQAFDQETDITQEGKKHISTATYLRTCGFGQPSIKHLYHVNGKPINNIVLFVFKINYLDKIDNKNLQQCHPLYQHLATQILRLHKFNFGQLTKYDPHFASQETIPCCTLQCMLLHVRYHAYHNVCYKVLNYRINFNAPSYI